jgi:hypothetical protein
VVLLGAVLVAAGLLVGIVDVLRPKSQQTHVGRFFDQVTNEGFSGFAVVIKRKAIENFQSFTTTRLVWLLPICVALLVYLWLTRRTALRTLVHNTAVVRHTLLAFALTAFLGYALNDSGIAIPALMVLVLECAVSFVVAADLDGGVPARTTTRAPRAAASPQPELTSYARSGDRA